MTDWQNRIVGSGNADPATLMLNALNWRTHPAHQQAAMGGVLDEVGWVQQVLVNKRTGRVVDGHLRVELARKRGEAEVPVLYVDLSEEEEALVLTTLDPIGALAGRNEDNLKALMAKVSTNNEAVRAMLDDLMRNGAPAPRPQGIDEIPDVRAEAVSFPGAVYELGVHRLVCGSAVDPDAWRALLGEDKLECVWTDPPYGVSLVGGSRAMSEERRKARGGLEIQNDKLDPEALRQFLLDTLGRMATHCKPGAAWYVASPSGDLFGEFAHVLGRERLGIWRHTIAWVKDSLVLGRADYHYRHESLLYGWVPGAGHYFIDDRTQDTVMEVPRPKVNKEHPTMKPVELVARCLRNSSKPDWLVGDAFGGSGTTLIAAAGEGMRARLMEIDPRYADVIRRRWTSWALSAGVDPGPGALQ